MQSNECAARWGEATAASEALAVSQRELTRIQQRGLGDATQQDRAVVSANLRGLPWPTYERPVATQHREPSGGAAAAAPPRYGARAEAPLQRAHRKVLGACYDLCNFHRIAREDLARHGCRTRAGFVVTRDGRAPYLLCVVAIVALAVLLIAALRP